MLLLSVNMELIIITMGTRVVLIENTPTIEVGLKTTLKTVMVFLRARPAAFSKCKIARRCLQTMHHRSLIRNLRRHLLKSQTKCRHWIA